MLRPAGTGNYIRVSAYCTRCCGAGNHMARTQATYCGRLCHRRCCHHHAIKKHVICVAEGGGEVAGRLSELCKLLGRPRHQQLAEYQHARIVDSNQHARIMAHVYSPHPVITLRAL